MSETALRVMSVVVGAMISLALLFVAAASRRENERRATRVALSLAVVLPLPYLAAGLLQHEHQAAVTFVLLAVSAGLAVALLVPAGGTSPRADEIPRSRIDERDIMFSRWKLEPGTDQFDSYYASRPDRQPLDDDFRMQPGLLAVGASAHNPFAFRAADASFWTIEQLRPFVERRPAGGVVESSPSETTLFLKRWALKLGAVSVGITRLHDYHLYSVIGRGAEYGEPVDLDHDFALAVTVEMDKEMIDRAPLSPTVMESAQQYVAAGVIAVQIADFIRRMGFQARAHIDGSYRVVCPLVARDAGLGEIGRMGLLMTPRLGPRVRIAVVTTDMPLVPDDRNRDDSVVAFCSRCEKCAVACPSNAIPRGERREIDGVMRWQVNQEACFTFWCKVGTDCARCIRVCPYSHPDNAMHNLVRWGVRKSALFRRGAILMDDVFYGRAPAPAELPDWIPGEAERWG